jgi:hypothetical protein
MKHRLNSHRKRILFYILLILKLLLVSQVVGQNLPSTDCMISESSTDSPKKLFGGEITNNGYGGPVMKISRFNGQLAFMTGGRGAVIIKNRYTIGGGGYGIGSFLWQKIVC